MLGPVRGTKGVLGLRRGIVLLASAAAGVGTCLVARRRAHDFVVRAATANARHVLMAEQVAWANHGRFLAASELESVLPNLPPVATYPASPRAMVPGTVYVSLLGGADVELSALVGNWVYTVVQRDNDTVPSTRYAVTPISAGRPDPAEVTGLAW